MEMAPYRVKLSINIESLKGHLATSQIRLYTDIDLPAMLLSSTEKKQMALKEEG